MTDELSPSEAASRIGTTTRTIQRWIVAGRLPARRVGGRWRVASVALDAFTSDETTSPGAVTDAAGAEKSAAVRPVRTLFVANRGEIAARIRRTADRLGITTFVPGSDGPTIDLLDPDAIIVGARHAGADALHPGYGFLAESADFAAAVEAAGIRWVGPPAGAIRVMGDKAAARRLATANGVPTLPGYDDADQADEALQAAAATIGTPLLVKPAAGGGGKGMRVVRDLAHLSDAVAAARRGARAAFGDDRLILERLLEGPRHVEVQVLFDAHGAGIHLGERDCSLQRRHQKVLEETPAPGVDETDRGRMADAALRLAAAVGYRSAGTCEFLLDDRGRFFFLEMNTRLQVEHPVTEFVTGRDLVADQLRIAAGERLAAIGASQEATDRARAVGGHAVEVRLYAEDAEDGFLPATGRVEALYWPSGPGIRVDAGIDVGADVGPRFDPMLAKIIAAGQDRAEALDRMARALDDALVLGLTTNLRFLRWLVREPVVLDGQARIDTLDRIWPPADWPERAAIPPEAWSAAAQLLVTTGDRPVADAFAGGWRLNGPAVARVSADGEDRSVTVGDVPAGVPEAFESIRAGDAVHLDLAGRSTAFCLSSPPDVDRAARAAAAHDHAGGSVPVVAPMPGAVLTLHVAAGDTVTAGDPIATLEAMKMEHVVVAPMAGRVTELLVRPADQVTRSQLLATIEA
jgi:acetyl-CoA/propionyl-CoA carboxylase, biotin carboxylase, biotin carboxyl carrier protein